MQTYTIKEMSKRFNIPASTLRYYEDLGLLPPVERTSSDQRIYTDCHISRLTGILCFKNTGLPLAQIQDFFRYEEDIPGHMDEILSLVTTHEQDIKQQIKEMKSNLAHIQHKVRYYNGIKHAIETGREWPCWEESSS